MRWKQFLTPVNSMIPEEAKEYISTHEEGSYTLLDVRQMKEYEAEHIPGSKLIPLPELSDRLTELDPESPTIVYCAVGGRSRVAAQVLSGQGFGKIYNLKGGIKAWQGQTAVGPVEEGMAFLRGDESPAEVLILAYGLEEGLEGFYREMASKTEEGKIADLFRQLSKLEEEHKLRIFELYQKYDPSVSDRQVFEEEVVSREMEDGISSEEFLEKNAPTLQTAQGILDLAMMIETQAFDLYSRYARKSQDNETQSVLFGMAEEEKSHLKTVAELKEEML